MFNGILSVLVVLCVIYYIDVWNLFKLPVMKKVYDVKKDLRYEYESMKIELIDYLNTLNV